MQELNCVRISKKCDRHLFAACLFLILFVSGPLLRAQFPPAYFRSPVDFPIELAGSFAELRGGHFHSGIDVKTGGQSGRNVYAVADGFVSRIKVSPFGFGKALYIEHPNGYTSVYAHLSRFSGPMAGYVEEMQYRKKSFAIDLYLTPHRFEVKKGDIVAKSGNSGSSSGPHLHFEIRKTAGQEPVNPQILGIAVQDHRAPQILELLVYGPSSFPQSYKLRKGEAGYVLANKENILEVPAGRVAFGIRVIDRMDKNSGKLGVYLSRVEAGGRVIFEWRGDRFSFSESRYANAHMDYALKKKEGKLVERLFKLPGDRLSMYGSLLDDGRLTLAPGETMPVLIVVRDASGNESRLSFKVNGLATRRQARLRPKSKRMLPGRASYFESGAFRIIIPEGALYDSIYFHFSVDSSMHKEGRMSPLFRIHDPGDPLHKKAVINILQSDFPESLKKRAVAVRVEDDESYYYTGEWSGPVFIFRTREFGNYYLSVDSTAPSIEKPAFPESPRPGDLLSIGIEDEESGIDKYNAYLDGRWWLMEYDYKKKRLTGTLPEFLKTGEHVIRVSVSDKAGNRNEKIYKLKINKP